MKSGWQRLLVAIACLLIACGSVWAATPEDTLRDQVLQLVAQHDDRQAARLLIDAWQAEVPMGSVSPGCVALNEALAGHFMTARPLMNRDIAEHPADSTRPVGDMLVVLLEGNPMACRDAIETVLKLHPRDSSLRQRYADALESLGISGPIPNFPDPAPAAPPMAEQPVATPEPPLVVAPTPSPTLPPARKVAVRPAPTPAPVRRIVMRSTPAPTPAPVVVHPDPEVAMPDGAPAESELKPVQGASEREILLKQLAQAQARQGDADEPDPAAVLFEQQKAAESKTSAQPKPAKASEQPRKAEKARLAAEQRRQAEAARQAMLAAATKRSELAKQAKLAAEKRHQAELLQQSKLAAEKKHQADLVKLAAQAKQRAPEVATRRPAASKRQLEQAEQKRWLAAKQKQSPVAMAVPAVPRVTKVLKFSDLRVGVAARTGGAKVVKPPKLPVPVVPRVVKPDPKHEVWIAETRSEVRARFGRPRQFDATSDRYPGLSVWYDAATGKVTRYRDESAWYTGVRGAHPGMTLHEVLGCLPNSDGIFHYRPQDETATESLYVLSTVDGTLVELQQAGDLWLSTYVEGTTPTGVADFYQSLTRQPGTLRRLAPDYVFALEARRRPLP